VRDRQRSRRRRRVRERRYGRVVETIGATPWAITPDALATILGIVGERAAGHKPTDDEIRERIGARAERATAPEGPVAVLPLYGPIVPRADLFSEVSGSASVEASRRRSGQRSRPTDVKAILIDVDSPGGDVDLIPELAAEILAARGAKPIVAIANTLARRPRTGSRAPPTSSS
jgi:ClpP class serine protease